MKLIDIGANLSDKMFKGIYNGKTYHVEDLHEVIRRSKCGNIFKIILTTSTISDIPEHFELIAKEKGFLYTTVGVHPCHANDMNDSVLDEMKSLIAKYGMNSIVAIGECGLDYDRLNYADKETQIATFKKHFELAKNIKLPLFLHDRNTGGDFLSIIKENRGSFSGGVVHSFTGTLQEALEYINLGLYIGINGCSLKTQENCEVVKALPVEKLLIESDAPWCSIRKSHYSFQYLRHEVNSSIFSFSTFKKEKFMEGCTVDGRNEPIFVNQVLQVLSKLKNIQLNELSEILLQNTLNLFPALNDQ